MKISEHNLLALYTRFIKDMHSGKRLQANGKRIKTTTISNYEFLKTNLELLVIYQKAPLLIRSYKSFTEKEWQSEKKYWKNFYWQFTEMLYKKGCHDNYVGSQVKMLKTFLNYITTQCNINIGAFYKEMYVLKEEVEIVVLLPERLRRLIYDKDFETSLVPKLQWIKDIFIAGSTIALRYGDLMNLKWSQLSYYKEDVYLMNKSEKTGTWTKVKLPEYLISIFEKYKGKIKKPNAKIFPPCSLSHFDKQLKVLFEKAGWQEIVEKKRMKRGKQQVVKMYNTQDLHRFCDLATSHMMRRTAITTMLMHGVQETIVRYISGHSSNSKSFYRYIAFVQPFVNSQLDKHFAIMEAHYNL